MAGSSDSWCLIESDPGVFTELVQSIGVKGIIFEELYGLDEHAFTTLRPQDVLGFIFLFKWTSENEHSDSRPVDLMPDPELFFAKQVIQNACATQAILSVILNLPDVQIGSDLRTFKEFTNQFSYADRGMAIGSSEVIRKAHNSFARFSSLEFAQDGDSGSDDSFHFISYVPFKGKVYELDGLKQGPILLGESGEKNWQSVVREEIQKRVEQLQNAVDGKSEIRFSLMAVVVDRLDEIQRDIEKHRHIRQRVNIKLVSCGENITLDDEVADELAPEGTPSIEDLPDDIEALKKLGQEVAEQLHELRELEQGEQAKRLRWKKENSRRRHDFVPFVLCAMRHMARRSELKDAYLKGKDQICKDRQEAKSKTAIASG